MLLLVISVYAICENGFEVRTTKNHLTIVDPFDNNKIVFRKKISADRLFYIDLEAFLCLPRPRDQEFYKYVNFTRNSDDLDSINITEEDISAYFTSYSASISDSTISEINDSINSDARYPTDVVDPVPSIKKRQRVNRLTRSDIEQVLWLHKCTGHAGRAAMINAIKNKAWANLPEDLDWRTVEKVFQRLSCTACELLREIVHLRTKVLAFIH